MTIEHCARDSSEYLRRTTSNASSIVPSRSTSPRCGTSNDKARTRASSSSIRRVISIARAIAPRRSDSSKCGASDAITIVRAASSSIRRVAASLGHRFPPRYLVQVWRQRRQSRLAESLVRDLERRVQGLVNRITPRRPPTSGSPAHAECTNGHNDRRYFSQHPTPRAVSTRPNGAGQATTRAQREICL